MKTFKNFIQEINKYVPDVDTDQDDNIGFATSSASNGDTIIEDKDTENGYATSSQSGEKSLKESTEIVHLHDKNDVIRDPKFHSSEHKSVDLNDVGLTHFYSGSHTEPHLTEDQAKSAKKLHDNVNVDHPSYKHAVSEYTYDSEHMNHALFKDKQEGTKTAHSGATGKLITHMDSVIGHHKLPQKTTVYSGLHFNPSDFHNGKVHLPAYTSTSLSPHVAANFGKPHRTIGDDGNPILHKHMMRLELPKGHNHVFTENHTNLPGEMEVILPRDTKLKFGDKPSHVIKKPGFSGMTIHHHIWDAHLDHD